MELFGERDLALGLVVLGFWLGLSHHEGASVPLGPLRSVEVNEAKGVLAGFCGGHRVAGEDARSGDVGVGVGLDDKPGVLERHGERAGGGGVVVLQSGHMRVVGYRMAGLGCVELHEQLVCVEGDGVAVFGVSVVPSVAVAVTGGLGRTAEQKHEQGDQRASNRARWVSSSN